MKKLIEVHATEQGKKFIEMFEIVVLRFDGTEEVKDRLLNEKDAIKEVKEYRELRMFDDVYYLKQLLWF